MKNPIVVYFLARIGIFVVTLAILIGIFPGQDWFFAALFAAVISFALSVILLRKQRDAFSSYIYERSQRRRDGMTKPGTKDVENDALDGKE
jgi:hypothetical protein